jgi:hypothetical protein
VEATALVARLKELVLHRGLEVEHSTDVNARIDDATSSIWTRKSDRPAPEAEPADGNYAAAQRTFTCPHDGCGLDDKFSREQDLLRHYALRTVLVQSVS